MCVSVLGWGAFQHIEACRGGNAGESEQSLACWEREANESVFESLDLAREAPVY